jgi:hypothetical protein
MDAVEERETAAAGGRDTDDVNRLSRRQVFRLIARAPDSYVLLLILLVVDYVTLTVVWSGTGAFLIRTVLYVLTVLLAFRTSRVGKRIQSIVRVGVAVTVLAAVGVAIAGGTEANGAVIVLTSILVSTSTLAIGWRILHHQQVSGETIAGAVCIYVLIGMIFALFDYGLQLVSGSPFFAESGHHGIPDFAYFSYITMTTVGYGDLTPASGLPRTMSVFDALVGQIFLVVLVARLVSMYRGPIGLREGVRERIRDDAEASGAAES